MFLESTPNTGFRGQGIQWCYQNWCHLTDSIGTHSCNVIVQFVNFANTCCHLNLLVAICSSTSRSNPNTLGISGECVHPSGPTCVSLPHSCFHSNRTLGSLLASIPYTTYMAMYRPSVCCITVHDGTSGFPGGGKTKCVETSCRAVSLPFAWLTIEKCGNYRSIVYP